MSRNLAVSVIAMIAFIGAARLAQPSTVGKSPLVLTSSIAGNIAAPDGSTITLSIQVASKVVFDGPGKVTLVYVFSIKDAAATPLALKRDANPGKLPVVIWESADSELYAKALSNSKVSVIDSKQTATIIIRADQYELTHKRLMVMVGNTVIAAGTAPAYIPRKAR